MLRLHTGRDAQGAKGYFDRGLSREDYYTEGREVTGTWHGVGAKILGLEGEVDRDRFHLLCDNVNPRSGEKLTPRNKANRRVGFDISFSVPKSVSIHQALTDNAEILEAFRASVRETMQEMERDAQTRVRKSGANQNRTTANLIWSEFTHYTARPVEGRSDPHLHAHCWTFNATYDLEEERWKALDLEAIWKRAPYYEAAFDSRLAGKLGELGYAIEQNDKGWELAGYSRETIEKFSRRTQLINEMAEERGIATDKLKSELGARTRESKQENEDKASQRLEWNGRLSESERQVVTDLESNRNASPQERRRPISQKTAAECLEFATLHAFERQSVAREASFLADAIRFGTGSVDVEDIRSEYQRRIERGEILAGSMNGEASLTTPKVLAEERAMVAWARDGRGSERALGEGPEARRAALGQLTAGGRHPDSLQIAAVEHVLTSQDRVMVVRGKAGTGKTTMMKSAEAGIRAGGKDVLFFAPGAEASRGVLVGEGFSDATTVAKLLLDEELQERARSQVIWVDEAGTLGARDMSALFQLAERVEARVILSGDATQHAAVARGDALRILENEAGLKPAELTRIYRQTNLEYRAAVESISRGDICGVEKGFDQLDAMGAVREIEGEERHAALAKDYLGTVLEEHKTALVVSPTHAEGEAVTARIREGLREAGQLGRAEQTVARLKSLGLTEAERGDARRFDPGLIVQVHGKMKGLKRGAQYEVVARANDRVWVNGGAEEGERIELPLREAAQFDVFERDAIALAKGDRIRITRNGMAESRTAQGRKQELRNGAIYEIAEFTPDGHLTAVHRDPQGRITSEVTINREFGNLTHGYCVTSHASQGKTVDRVLIAQSAQAMRANSREQFYVSVSRGREGVVIYTDDKEALRHQVIESAARISASEFERERTAQREEMKQHVLWIQRIRQEARDFARAQVAALMRGVERMRPMMRRDRNGPERSL